MQATGVVAVSQPRPRDWPDPTRHTLPLLTLTFAGYGCVGLGETAAEAIRKRWSNDEVPPTHAPVAGAATSAHFLVSSQAPPLPRGQFKLTWMCLGPERMNLHSEAIGADDTASLSSQICIRT
jgi:hypothetical protein